MYCTIFRSAHLLQAVRAAGRLCGSLKNTQQHTSLQQSYTLFPLSVVFVLHSLIPFSSALLAHFNFLRSLYTFPLLYPQSPCSSVTSSFLVTSPDYQITQLPPYPSLLIATTLSLNLCGNGQVYNSRRCYEIQPDAMPSRV